MKIYKIYMYILWRYIYIYSSWVSHTEDIQRIIGFSCYWCFLTMNACIYMYLCVWNVPCRNNSCTKKYNIECSNLEEKEGAGGWLLIVTLMITRHSIPVDIKTK